MYYFVNGGVPNNPGFNALPRAVQMKILNNMAYGGRYSYQNGGIPNRGEYGDNEEQYQIDMDNYMQNIGSIDYPSQIASTIPVDSSNSYFNLNPYQGVSVYDFLTAQGKAGDLQSRKGLAKTLGIDNYAGTPTQNAQMMEMIRQNPNILSGYTQAPVIKKSFSPRYSNEDLSAFRQEEVDRMAAENPYITSRQQPSKQNKSFSGWMPPTAAWTPPTGRGSNSNLTEDSSNFRKTGIMISAIGAGIGTGMLGAIEALDMLNKIKRNELGKFSGTAKAKLTRSINNLRNQALKTGTQSTKSTLDWYKALPKEQQNILKNLDLMEIPGDIYTMPRGTAARDLYTRDMLNEAAAEDFIHSNINTAKALKEAEEEAKALRSANAAKAANIRWGKTAAAAKELGLGEKALLNFLKVSKFIRGKKEEGGELPMAQTGINWDNYKSSGIDPYRTFGRADTPDTFKEDVYEFFDPSGVLSWDDLKETYNDPNASTWDKFLAMASVIPVIGEVPKVGKGAKAFLKGLAGLDKATQAAKATTKVGKIISSKPVRYTGKALDFMTLGPLYRTAQRANPAMMATGLLGQKLISKAPKVVRGTSRGLGFASQIGKESNLIDAGIKKLTGQYDPSSELIKQQELINSMLQEQANKNPYIVEPSISDTTTDDSMQYWRKNGGSTPNDNYTYYQGMSYQGGGTFVPMYGDSAYGLPQFSMGSAPQVMYGMGMAEGGMYQDGGQQEQQFVQTVVQMLQQMPPKQVMDKLVQAGVPQDKAAMLIQEIMKKSGGNQMAYGGVSSGKLKTGQKLNVTSEELEDLRRQGYDFDIIG